MDRNELIGIIDALQTFVTSPAYVEVKETVQKTRENILPTFYRFANVLESYRQPFLDNVKHLLPILQQFTKMVNIASLASYLGEMQIVWWKIPDLAFIKEVTENREESIRNSCINDWFTGYDPAETIEILKANKDLSEYPVFWQSLDAYENGNYDVAILGFIACFDRVLSVCSGIPTQKLEKRVKELVDRLENNEEEDDKLSEADYSEYYLLVTYQIAIESFIKFASFVDPEPSGLNRHWIMHGRTERKMMKTDCYKLINMLYSTILIADKAKE